ncbi:deoxyguanosinetriphosphate triphosphohydrolase [Thermosediminibacter oceani]|uniref:Deoxyguanosinetriphosphate triphosphohydrolase-like protein n=1 Tax=Thermosediminibacter oceani (strain ATCC BAA-1034 / DSM 16646 / JW/IW-1228P) TaxID=555079 RepID=D9S2R5_THEOJ|nr:deoxyguanosinetriphosphate triphosphohydrolase [Thermosediminibacter oceani]ADL07692.1 deoxyguanosinetriphosphate triphosphohydrolase [Thermosediminibacter oceani DSM 16646]
MNIREITEELEERMLSPYATLSSKTRGRKVAEEKCTVRTEFQRDRDRILHSKAFRRLKHKTQVFITPEGDHYRTRLTHTLEVAQIARTISRALRLNEDLTEAIALGHDLGHTPFGHTGEVVLNRLMKNGFRHEEQSLRVVEVLEQGNGLNLTWEVRDGILNHTSRGNPSTLEGQVVKLADWIAYINHDIDDAIRAGILRETDLPSAPIKILGDKHAKRIDTMIKDIINESFGKPFVRMSQEVYSATVELREFMFERVYIGSSAKSQEIKAQRMLELMFEYFIKNVDSLPAEFIRIAEREGVERGVCDYIAGMTDSFATYKFREIFVPSPWPLSRK